MWWWLGGGLDGGLPTVVYFKPPVVDSWLAKLQLALAELTPAHHSFQGTFFFSQ